MSTRRPRLHGEVLVAEDEPFIRELIVRTLHDAGLRTREARTGQEAIDAVHEHAPDLLVLDLRMPGRNGFEVLDSLDGSPPIPTLVVSAWGDAHGADARRHGANEVLTKPFRAEELLRHVGRLLAPTG